MNYTVNLICSHHSIFLYINIHVLAQLLITTYTISSTWNLPKFLSLNSTHFLSVSPHFHLSIDRSIFELSSNNARQWSFSLVIEIHSVPSSLNARYHALETLSETRHTFKPSNAIIALNNRSVSLLFSLSFLDLNRPGPFESCHCVIFPIITNDKIRLKISFSIGLRRTTRIVHTRGNYRRYRWLDDDEISRYGRRYR